MCEKDRVRKRERVRKRDTERERERDNTKGKPSLLAGNYSTKYISIKCRKKINTSNKKKRETMRICIYIEIYIYIYINREKRLIRLFIRWSNNHQTCGEWTCGLTM